MSFNKTDNTANIIRSYSEMLAGRLTAMGKNLMATKQRAAGNVAAQVYLALQTNDKAKAIKAMRMMNQYSDQIFNESVARITGGAYAFSNQSVVDKMKHSLAQEQNKKMIEQMQSEPPDKVLNFLQMLFQKFNQFVSG